jgi:hypothetical protein
MKLLIAILVIVVLGALLVADYKWRRWIAARRRDRER